MTHLIGPGGQQFRFLIPWPGNLFSPLPDLLVGGEHTVKCTNGGQVSPFIQQGCVDLIRCGIPEPFFMGYIKHSLSNFTAFM